jgi:hypothetical protein
MDEGDRQPIPPMAWVLSGATGLALGVLAVILLLQQGQTPFFSLGDSKFFLLIGRDLFGTGHGFAAIQAAGQIPYRYGRVGLPFVAWILAFGRPGLVGWTLIGVNLVALAAIPGLAACFLAEHRAPPAAAALVLILPAFILLYGSVLSDPLVIALLLLAFVLDARSHRRATLVTLACAILVKEVAVLALVPLLWRAARRRDWRGFTAVSSTVLPYAAWCVWVRLRMGEFPFLAHTKSRTEALGLPFAGIHYTIRHYPLFGAVIFGALIATLLLGFAGAWVARGTQISALAAIYTLLVLCLGPQALKFFGEVIRVLLLPEVFGLLALVIGLSARRRAMHSEMRHSEARPENHGLFVDNTYL